MGGSLLSPIFGPIPVARSMYGLTHPLPYWVWQREGDCMWLVFARSIPRGLDLLVIHTP